MANGYNGKILRVDLSRGATSVYAMVSWDNEGKPTRAKLQELGIEWVAEA